MCRTRSNSPTRRSSICGGLLRENVRQLLVQSKSSLVMNRSLRPGTENRFEPNRSVGTARRITAGVLRYDFAGDVEYAASGYRSPHGHRKKSAECAADRRRGNRPMRTIKLSQASRPLAEYTDELDDEIVVLTKKNRPVAAIVPLRNVDRESLSLSTNPKFLKLSQRSRADFAAGRKRSLQEVHELFGLQAPGSKSASPSRGRGIARRKPANPRRGHSG